jgi:hypothetical protein
MGKPCPCPEIAPRHLNTLTVRDTLNEYSLHPKMKGVVWDRVYNAQNTHVQLDSYQIGRKLKRFSKDEHTFVMVNTLYSISEYIKGL